MVYALRAESKKTIEGQFEKSLYEIILYYIIETIVLVY